MTNGDGLSKELPTNPGELLADDGLDQDIYAEHQSIPNETAQNVLKRDTYRCQTKGCVGTEQKGSARLVVQRIKHNPLHCGENDPENLVTRCLRCSRWIRRMPSTDDLQPILQERLDGVDIEATWTEILQYLADHGPATTGEITESVSLSSKLSVRRALYGLMGINQRENIDGRLVVKDRVNGVYGLPWQIPDEHDAQGIIPLRPAARRSRILDELVRRLLDELPENGKESRELVARVVDRDPHQTYQMERRAEAFDFPFERWADTKRPRQDAAAVIEAIDVLAGGQDNVSRQMIADVVADLFGSNDEEDLAKILLEWARGEQTQPQQQTLDLPSTADNQHCPDSDKNDSPPTIRSPAHQDLNDVELAVLEEIGVEVDAFSGDTGTEK